MKTASFVTSTFLAGSLLLPLQATAAYFDRIYVFSDSLSDTGNLYEDTNGIYPPSFPPDYTFPYYQGRFSNGPLWIEYLTDELGLTETGIFDFAYGGATTGNQNVAELVVGGDFPGLLDQIETFKATPRPEPPTAGDLFVVWAGANDYLFGFETSVEAPITHLVQSIDDLIDIGAQNILVLNLPDLGNVPEFVGTISSPTLNLLTSQHNTRLFDESNELQNNNPGTELTYVDINYFFKDVAENPSLYGFSNLTDSCLTVANNIFKACDNPDEYLFWDNFHPTTKTHQSIGKFVLRTLIPEPASTASLLVFGLSGSLAIGVKAIKSRIQKK